MRKKADLSVLFTCIGRRVSLLERFRAAAKSLKIRARFIGTETTPLSPALQVCDEAFLVKPVSEAGYIKDLYAIVKAEGIGLIVPTVDLDLGVLAEHKEKLASLGCRALVSEREVVGICQDKRRTYEFLKQNDFDTPITLSPKEALKAKLIYPRFLKPWDGYASRGNAIVTSREELALLSKRIPNCIVQEYIAGTEYTCDVYVDFDMAVRCVVPRKRIEVRSGEVSKGQVVKDRAIMETAAAVIEKLGAGPGVITMQCIKNVKGQIKVTEINPRFGGGVPLSIEAGANFPKWILHELTGGRPRIRFDAFEDDLIMLRYDCELWLRN